MIIAVNFPIGKKKPEKNQGFNLVMKKAILGSKNAMTENNQ